ncbi:MAG: biliverdin-producing heme oxygenase [Candidatus Competibacter sp.]|nr:biliverdin-producing heme oxygenase [Candidatus Competibacter sp.]MDG4584716.1 biliverdin-producing heme oxygenase [Candidatus Competibacter sp.]
MPTSSLMTRLHEATDGIHAQIQELPYPRALESRDLPLESYVGHLRAMAVLHGVLERELPILRDSRLRAVWSENMRRFSRVRSDLAFFAPRAVLDIPAAHEVAKALADRILQRSLDAPVTLLGYLYVLEGSILGAEVLAPLAKEAFGLDRRRGLAYLEWDGAVARERWRGFGERMDAVSVTAEEVDVIVAAAVEAFVGIRRVLEALYPFDPAVLTLKVTALNPEAGAHPMPDDPGEVEAAIHAGRRCCLEYPYFAWRYGERGQRYASSDSAWLATLIARDQATVDAQVEWLGVVLASRGMPRILLQRHLELLYEELVARAPERREEDFAKLMVAADRLADQRRAIVADADFDAIRARFEQAVGPDWRARLPGVGAMLVSAVADQIHGIEDAVASLEDWLTDPNRFPPHWIAAVRDALREARARAVPLREEPGPTAD